jgi:3-oxoacyl-ACP reductase-like protein
VTAPQDDAKGQRQEAAPATAEAAPAAIAPPPPPADAPAAEPPTVALGQTPDQVVAILGPPLRKAKIGTKEIYSYKDLKVTFLNGKVKDIQ